MGTTSEVGTFGTRGKMAEAGTFGTKGRLAGEPKKQRDSEDGTETIEINLGGGNASIGLLIYRSGQTTPDFIPSEDIFGGSSYTYEYDPENDDDWSLEFGVTNGFLDDFTTSPPVGDSGTDLYDGDISVPTSQSFYRIPVIRTIDGEKLEFNVSGIYRENRFCAGSKGGMTELIKIG